MLKNKKSIELWLSWVLLVAFTISMGAVLTTWMLHYANSTSDSIKRIVYDESDCNYVSLEMIYVCNTTSSIDISLKNTGTLNIDAVVFRFYEDENADVISTKRYNFTDGKLTFKPSRIKDISFQETKNLYIVEAIPIIYKDNEEIVCQKRKATTTQICESEESEV